MKYNSAKDIVSLLDQKVEQVVKYLLPNGKRKGSEWCVGSVSGEVGESLKVCLSGDKTGIWRDFAANEGGDLLNLWCCCRNKTISEALLEAKEWLGIASPTFVPLRRSESVKPVLKNEIEINASSKVAQYLINERKLSFETLKKFKIMEHGDEIVFRYDLADQLAMLKYLKVDRPQGKKQIRVTPNSIPCLFGWQAIPKEARTAVLVEGEIDAMSLHELGIGKEMAVFSVPFGGGKGAKQQWIENEFEALTVFDEIYLCMDIDETGKAATNELTERLGRARCKIVTLPFKDANECLQEGLSSEVILKCFNEAMSLDPAELKRASSFISDVIDAFYPSNNQVEGYYLPWGKVEGKINLREGELSLWTGINGHGKSQLLGQVLLNCMRKGAKVCIASLELKPKRLLYNLTRQASGMRTPTNEYIRAIHDWYNSRLWLFDLVGTAKTKRLLEVFEYARQRYGVDVFVIDSFMKCGIAEDDFKAQKEFVEQLCDFKNEHNCHIHLVVHPRKGSDELTPPGKLDMKGSGAVSDLADNCFSVWRNKQKEENIRTGGTQALEQTFDDPDCMLSCDKQRNSEWEGKCALWFNRDSFQYLENPNHKPRQIVKYTNVRSKEDINE